MLFLLVLRTLGRNSCVSDLTLPSFLRNIRQTLQEIICVLISNFKENGYLCGHNRVFMKIDPSCRKYIRAIEQLVIFNVRFL